ncbi:hypothetical protein F383_19363 [Gossypium arboreum]|uniref:Uncharacterized protein n=1 Tax=Gossypium arboreum TaxID=29729 RepID=A0A0B0NL99_GOSAR|nr:hypothetical protein F383_19363 [Gossypium arboreum]
MGVSDAWKTGDWRPEWWWRA